MKAIVETREIKECDGCTFLSCRMDCDELVCSCWFIGEMLRTTEGIMFDGIHDKCPLRKVDIQFTLKD